MALPDPAIACLHADLVRKLTTENITPSFTITICKKKNIYICIYMQIIISFVQPRILEYQMEYLECHVSTDS